MPALDFEDTQKRDECIKVDIFNKRDFFRNDLAGTRNFTWTKDGFLDTTSGWKDRYVTVNLGDLSADSDDYDYPLLRFPVDVTITNVEIAVDTTIVADATNYNTFTIYSSGRSTAMVTALSTATGFTLHVPRAFTGITATTGKLAAGDTMYLSPVATASGKAMSGVSVAVTFTVDRPEAVSGDQEDNLLQIINGEAGSDGLIESDHLLRDHLIQRRNNEVVMRIDVDGIMTAGPTYTPPDMYHVAMANIGTIVAADSEAKKCVLIKPNGTIQIDKIYFGADTTAAADSETAYMEVIVCDGSDNKIASAFVHGPAGAGQALTAGRLYDMGEISDEYSKISSSEQVEVQFLALGSPSDIAGLTVAIVYRKID